MKILYVAGMPLPIENLLSGKSEIEGFPAFYFPMRKLIERGHQLRFILMSNFEGPFEVKVDWFSSEWIVANIFMKHSERRGPYRVLRRASRAAQLFAALLKEARADRYDLIYAHGAECAFVAQIVGELTGTLIGVRWYGDTDVCLRDISNFGALQAALRNPVHYANFVLRHAFFLATDDGTGVDAINAAWRPKRSRSRFYHWKTGIEFKEPIPSNSSVQVPLEKYIFHAARFQHRKRQDRVVSLLHMLHERGIHLHLYLAGHLEGGPSSQEYIAEVRGVVQALGLEDYVHFLGGVSQDTVRILARHAVATVLLQDHSNLGNFFYEAMSVGAVLVVSDDGSASQFVVDGESGFVVSNISEAADAVERVYWSPQLAEQIRRQAISVARQEFMSAQERFDKEVALIEGVHGNLPCE